MLYLLYWTRTNAFRSIYLVFLRVLLVVKELIWIFALYTFAKLIICTLEYGEWNIRSNLNFDWLKLEENMHKLIIDNFCE